MQREGREAQMMGRLHLRRREGSVFRQEVSAASLLSGPPGGPTTPAVGLRGPRAGVQQNLSSPTLNPPQTPTKPLSPRMDTPIAPMPHMWLKAHQELEEPGSEKVEPHRDLSLDLPMFSASPCSGVPTV